MKNAKKTKLSYSIKYVHVNNSFGHEKRINSSDLNFIGAELTISYHPLDEILAIGEILVIIFQVIQVNEKSANIDKTQVYRFLRPTGT